MARWIVFTIIEGILECVLIAPVITAVLKLQISSKTKLRVIVAFAGRLAYAATPRASHPEIKSANRNRIWVPLWIHLAFYIQFTHTGRTNIDIVSTIVIEDLWVAFALVSASVPLFLRVGKEFTTSGVVLGTATASRSKETLNRSYKMRSVNNNSINGNIQHERVFCPDYVGNIQAVIKRGSGEDVSIGSTAGSHVGILKRVEFEVSSSTK